MMIVGGWSGESEGGIDLVNFHDGKVGISTIEKPKCRF